MGRAPRSHASIRIPRPSSCGAFTRRPAWEVSPRRRRAWDWPIRRSGSRSGPWRSRLRRARLEPRGRGCHLTEAGRLLADLIGPLVSGAATLKRRFHEARVQLAPRLVLAASPRILAEDLPECARSSAGSSRMSNSLSRNCGTTRSSPSSRPARPTSACSTIADPTWSGSTPGLNSSRSTTSTSPSSPRLTIPSPVAAPFVRPTSPTIRCSTACAGSRPHRHGRPRQGRRFVVGTETGRGDLHHDGMSVCADGLRDRLDLLLIPLPRLTRALHHRVMNRHFGGTVVYQVRRKGAPPFQSVIAFMDVVRDQLKRAPKKT